MPARGPYAKTAATREQVLDAALRVIADRGYSGATLQEVADAVGMSKAGVLHHFGSRDTLLTAVLEHRDQVDAERIPLEGQPLLPRFIERIRFNQTVPGLVALFAALSGSSGAETKESGSRVYFEKRYADLRADLTARVAQEQREGRIRTDLDAAKLASLIVAAADGLQTQWLLDESIDMTSHLRVLEQLMQGDSPRPRA